MITFFLVIHPSLSVAEDFMRIHMWKPLVAERSRSEQCGGAAEALIRKYHFLGFNQLLIDIQAVQKRPRHIIPVIKQYLIHAFMNRYR